MIGRIGALLIAAAVMAAVGLALRVWVASYIPLGGDEALTGLMAKDVLRGDPWWILAGNAYGGTAETFLAAPLLDLFPASAVALRSVSVALWMVAAVLLGLSARRFVDASAAVLVAGTYWLLSWSTISLSVRAYAGYAAGAAAFAGWLLLQIDDVSSLQPERGVFSVRRIALGVLAGFAVWQHPLFLAPLVPGLLMAAVSHRRELLRWAWPVGCGILIGISPFLGYNVLNSWPSFVEPPTPASWSYTYRLANIVFTGFPRVLGLRLGQPTFLEAEAPWVGGLWGRGLALATGLLVASAFVLAIRRPGAARLIGVTGLVSPLLLALFRNSIRNVDGRHIALFYPFLALLALALAVRAWWPTAWHPRPILIAILPLAWALIFALPGLFLERRHPVPVKALPRVQASLDAAGVRFVRGDHWIVYPLTFETDERIQGAELSLVRFPRYEAAVTSAGSELAYIFREGSPERLELKESLARDPRFRRLNIGAWTLFLPR